MHGNRQGFEFLFGDAAAAVDCRIRVEYSLIPALFGNADFVIVPLYRTEVADRNDLLSVVVAAAECNDALLVVVVGDPAESLPRVVVLPQCRVFQIELVQIL